MKKPNLKEPLIVRTPPPVETAKVPDTSAVVEASTSVSDPADIFPVEAPKTLGLYLSGHGLSAESEALVTKQGLIPLESPEFWTPWIMRVLNLHHAVVVHDMSLLQPQALDLSHPFALSVGVCQQMMTSWTSNLSKMHRDLSNLGHKSVESSRMSNTLGTASIADTLATAMFDAIQVYDFLDNPDIDTQRLVSALLRDVHRLEWFRLKLEATQLRTGSELIYQCQEAWGNDWLCNNLRRTQILMLREFSELT